MAHVTSAQVVIDHATQGLSDAKMLSRLEAQLPPLLSATAGMVDLLGFFTLGNVFTAHITGNLVVVGAAIARGGPWSPAQVLTIPVFVAALAAIWGFARVSGSRGVQLAYQLLIIQFLSLTVVFFVSIWMHPSAHPHGPIAVMTAMIAIFAMASQYAVFRLAIPHAVSTAVMTGNLTNATLSLVDKLSTKFPMLPDDNDRLKQSLRLLIGFFLGCVVAAAAIPLLGDWAWSLPVLLAAVAVVYLATIPRSTTHTWSK